MLNWITILPLVCTIFVSVLGVFVFSRDRHSRINQLFFAFCVAMFFWLFGTFMMFYSRDNVSAAIWWDRFVYLGVAMMPALMHHFSLAFTKNKGQRKLLFFTYLVSILFVMVSRTPYFVDGVYVYGWGLHSQARILHHVFLGFFYFGIQTFFINLWRYYRKTKDAQIRKQVIFVFAAFAVVMFIGGTAYLAAYNIDLKFPFSYFSGLVFPFLLFYAITRHNLLGTKVITTEILVGAVIFVLMAQLLVSRDTQEIIFRILLFIFVAFFGFYLIRNVRVELKQTEFINSQSKKLEDANEHLRVLDEAKSEFLSIAAHQLRTPLTITAGYVSLLKDGAYGVVNKKLDHIFSAIDQNNRHLNQLVDEFLDITRLEENRTKYFFKKFDLKQFLEDTIEKNKEMAVEKGVKIILNLPNDTIEVSLDEEKMSHVLGQLLANSLKYGQGKDVHVGLDIEDNDAVIKIQDNGIGIDKKDVPNMFQKFYRSNNAKMVDAGGVGLGLYLCHKFVEAHSGVISVVSAGINKGSTFIIKLPLV